MRYGGNNDLAKVCLNLDGHILNAPNGVIDQELDTSNTLILDVCRTCLDGLARLPEELPCRDSGARALRQPAALRIVCQASRKHRRSLKISTGEGAEEEPHEERPQWTASPVLLPAHTNAARFAGCP